MALATILGGAPASAGALTLQEKIERAGDNLLVERLVDNRPGRRVRLAYFDKSRPGTRPGSSSHSRYLYLGCEVAPDAAPRVREYVDIERRRGARITKSLRRTGFTDAQKREAKRRDGGCVGNGRYGECSDTQPLELCQVDHVDPDGPNALWNAQTLCGNCHDWKTAVENGWWMP